MVLLIIKMQVLTEIKILLASHAFNSPLAQSVGDLHFTLWALSRQEILLIFYMFQKSCIILFIAPCNSSFVIQIAYFDIVRILLHFSFVRILTNFYCNLRSVLSSS